MSWFELSPSVLFCLFSGVKKARPMHVNLERKILGEERLVNGGMGVNW